MSGGVRPYRPRPTSASLSHGNLLTVSSARNGGSSSSILSSATTSASSVAEDEEGEVKDRNRRRTKHVQWRRGKSESGQGRRLRTTTVSSRGSESEDDHHGPGRVSRSGCSSRAGSGVRTVYDRYNLSPRHSRPRSRLSGSVVSLADSEVSYLKDVLRGAFSLDELYIPSHDLKILERMALRVQMERERELKAERKRELWYSQEKLAREERAQRIEEYRRRVADQWRREQEAMMLRKMKIEQRRQSTTAKIRQEVDERHKHAYEQLERLKMSRQEQLRRQHETYMARKMRLDCELRRREQEEMVNKLKKLEESESRMRIAEECRRRAAEMHRQRLAQAYQQSREYNFAKRYEVLKKADTVLESVRRRMAEREEHATANYKEVVSRRNEQLRLQSDELRRRMDHVSTVRRQLNAGFEQWRRKVEDLQAASLERAQTAVMQDLERKARCIREAEERRKSGQELNKKRIDAQEAVEEKHRRRRLASKDKKSEMLKIEKERTIQDSRVIANTTACLRDRLRRSLSPDTFDKKAKMATAQLRFVRRPATATLDKSPGMKSHILLG